MQLRKLAAAGAISALMAGATIGFAADLSSYPQPFISSSGSADFLVVVGSQGTDPQGLASDVAAAIDVAASLGSRASKATTVGATTGGVSVSGEGKEIATSNTKIYLDDTLGKSGARNTMTKDEMPTLLADGTVVDTNGTSYKYQQFIYLTPTDTTSTSAFRLQFAKPGAGGSEDPDYTIGSDITTSPSSSTYLYRTTVSFDKSLPKSTAIGQKIKLFGKEFTIHSDSTFTGTAKLVLAGGSDKTVMTGAETKDITVAGKTYKVNFVGATSATVGVVNVNGEQKSITKGTSQKYGDLSIYMDDVFYLSTTDQTQNSGTLLIGADKIVLQNSAKVKTGDNEDSVDGTSVSLTTSGDQISAFTIYTSAKSTSADFIKKGGKLTDPTWKSFDVSFSGLSEDSTASTRDKVSLQNSGDNDLQVTFTDYRGSTNTFVFAHKATSSAGGFSLQDASAKTIHVVENATISQDQYFVTDAGQFGHMYKVTSVTADGTSSASIGLSDVMSGTTMTVTLGTDNTDQKVIDGQTYYFQAQSSSTFGVTWGTGAAANNTGSYVTVFPTVKTQRGGRLALTAPNQSIILRDGQNLSLPTGAVQADIWTNGPHAYLNLTAVNREDGTTSVASGVANFNISDNATLATLTLGRTATGAMTYTILASGYVAHNQSIAMNITAQSSSGVNVTQPAILLVEEKDNAGDEYSVILPVTSESSGSNNVAKADAPTFTGTEDSSSLGSNSDITHYVDLWGTFAVRNTNGQDTIKVYYPDEQVSANVFVLSSGAATASSGSTGGSTIQESVPISTAVARLDSEIDATSRQTKNLILVGGPVVNSLVAELAAAGKTWDATKYRTNGEGTYVLDYVDGAFASGKAALVVAGHSAADTRSAAAKLVNPSGLTGARMAWKNNVVLSDTA